MTFFQEANKIIAQLLGTHNMFGYKSTPANQFFLLYYFGGSFYFSDQIHWHIRFLFVSLHLCGISIGCALGLWHFVYNMDSPPWFHLYTFNFVGTPVLLGVFFPIMLYRYKTTIETAIREMDIILTTNQEFTLKKSGLKFMNIRKVILINMIGISAFATTMTVARTIDVILFYEDDKTRNIMFYMIPVAKTEQYGRLEFYLVTNTICSTAFSFIVFQWMSLVFLIVLWYATCCNQIILLGRHIRIRSAELNAYADAQHEVIEAWNQAFENVIAYASNRFQEIIR